VAVKKLGVIGCQVRIIPPGIRLPDDFEMTQPPAEEKAPEKPTQAIEAAPAVAPIPAETKPVERKSELDRMLEEEPGTTNASNEIPIDSVKEEPKSEPTVNQSVAEDAPPDKKEAESEPCESKPE
jgi:small subunit ribosomal protein S3